MRKGLNVLAVVGMTGLVAACASEGERFGFKWKADIDLGSGPEPASIEPRLDAPRIAPVTMETATPRQRAMLAPVLASENGRSARNVYGSLFSHPDFADKVGPFLSYILRESTLPPRDREILILRTGWRNKALYEWEHHKTIGLAAGLTTQEIEAIAKGPDAKTWTGFDAALVSAADELKDDAFISDATWATLKTRYTDQQMIDLIATVGDYTFVSMFLNSLGVQLEQDEE